VTARLGPRAVRGGKNRALGSYLSYRGTRLADQAKEDLAETDSIKLESNSTTNRRWEIRLTCGPHPSAKQERRKVMTSMPRPSAKQGRETGGRCGLLGWPMLARRSGEGTAGLRGKWAARQPCLGRPKLAGQANQAAKVRRVSNSFYFL
jgi:hypothetical protein